MSPCRRWEQLFKAYSANFTPLQNEVMQICFKCSVWKSVKKIRLKKMCHNQLFLCIWSHSNQEQNCLNYLKPFYVQSYLCVASRKRGNCNVRVVPVGTGKGCYVPTWSSLELREEREVRVGDQGKELVGQMCPHRVSCWLLNNDNNTATVFQKAMRWWLRFHEMLLLSVFLWKQFQIFKADVKYVYIMRVSTVLQIP